MAKKLQSFGRILGEAEESIRVAFAKDNHRQAFAGRGRLAQKAQGLGLVFWDAESFAVDDCQIDGGGCVAVAAFGFKPRLEEIELFRKTIGANKLGPKARLMRIALDGVLASRNGAHMVHILVRDALHERTAIQLRGEPVAVVDGHAFGSRVLVRGRRLRGSVT